MNGKIIFYLIILASFGQSVFARQVVRHAGPQLHHRPIHSTKGKALVNGILKNQLTRQTNKNMRTMETGERLIAYSGYNYNDSESLTFPIPPVSLQDTGIFIYSLSRNSIFDFNHMSYNFVYYVDGNTPMGFGGYVGFTGKNNQPDILFDSSISWALNYNPPVLDSIELSDMQIVQYDTNYNVLNWEDLGTLDSTTTYDDDRAINTYDVNSNILTSMLLSWDLGYWDTTEYRTFMYNGTMQVVEDSTNAYMGVGSWLPEEKWYYTFDDSGNIVFADYYLFNGSTWQESEQIYMRYYPNNKLEWDSICNDFSGPWEPSETDTFTYTTGIDYVNTYTMYTYDSLGPWGSYVKYIKHINGYGLPDTLWEINIYSDSTIAYAQKYSFQYDSYQEPTTSNTYYFNIDTPLYTTGWYDSTIDQTTHYYYEPYTERVIHTAVNTVPNPGQVFVLYPNPAGNEVNINRQGYTQGAYTIITLTDALGHQLRSESLPWLSPSQSFSLQGLASGIYWLTIQDRSGAVQYRGQVVKE